jgi:hypothetical protein
MAHLKLPLALPLLLSALAFGQSPAIHISVDASDAPRRLIHATMQFPVKPGPIDDLAGIRMKANGQTGRWHRDDVNIYAHDSGGIIDVHLNTRAFKAGLSPDTRVVAVNGRQFSLTVLHQAVQDSLKTDTPIALLIEDGEYYPTSNIDYHDGEKYPHVIRDKSQPDLISEIIRPRATVSKPSPGGPR